MPKSYECHNVYRKDGCNVIFKRVEEPKPEPQTRDHYDTLNPPADMSNAQLFRWYYEQEKEKGENKK